MTDRASAVSALQEEDEELATLGAKTRLVSRRSPATPNPPLRLSKPAPSAWQLYFADWIQRHQASSSKKLSVAQAAKEASQEFARLTAEEKEVGVNTVIVLLFPR